MLVYSVSYFSSDSRMKCVNGVWCVCSSLEKAQRAIQIYMERYEETLLDMKEKRDGLIYYYTNEGRYIIECIELDDI